MSGPLGNAWGQDPLGMGYLCPWGMLGVRTPWNGTSEGFSGSGPPGNGMSVPLGDAWGQGPLGMGCLCPPVPVGCSGWPLSSGRGLWGWQFEGVPALQPQGGSWHVLGTGCMAGAGT